MSTRRKPKEGTILRISLGNESFAFARVLPNFQMAFYAGRTSQADDSSPAAPGSDVLWKLTVMKSAFTSDRWPVVGHRPLEAALAAPVEYFMRDSLTGRYSIYRSSDGNIRESTYVECKSLEAMAVWEIEHVEDRLRDHFAGRSNVWAEQLKAVP